MPDKSIMLRRRLNSQHRDGITLLDAVEDAEGNRQTVRLFFKAGTPQDNIKLHASLELLGARSIGDGPMLHIWMKDGDDRVKVSVEGRPFKIKPALSETNLFEGLNVIFAVRNGETAEATLDWLRFHVTHHGMQAALILNRARPGSDPDFDAKLEAGAADMDGLRRLVLLEADIPLGQADLPAEAHPFNVPGAPGKDRMDIPPPDAWTSPLGDLLIYELARARFLKTARAVANIDVHDLLAVTPGPDVFDRTVASRTGVLRLEGAQVYPWRVRVNQPAQFGDHICVQFDATGSRNRWCVAPQKAGEKAVWRLIRIVGSEPESDETATFNRHMALRHPTESVSKIVPKTSLIENEALLTQAVSVFDHNPVRMPEEKMVKPCGGPTLTTIVTTMKNEGPFILEWIAYHRMIGVTNFVVYTNDCTDGTDTMLQLLQEKGYLQHRDNPFKGTDLKPQHAALQAAEAEPAMLESDWLICMDVDEFLNIRTGEGRLEDLFRQVGDANMISVTWRLFGNNDVHEYEDKTLCETYFRCAPELSRKPHQAWGFKTLFRNLEIFKKLGVHRPKGLKPQLWEDIHWVNGSGKPMPPEMYRNGWRSTSSTYGYDLVQLNHYAVRSAESFLVKRDRGRVNHVDRDQGLAYWFRMNNNAENERSIQRMLPELEREMARMMEDPDIAAAHAYSVAKHREKIAELRATENYAAFYAELTSPRMEKLSRMHLNFGANVFLAGPESVPDSVLEMATGEPFFFTVEKGETEH